MPRHTIFLFSLLIIALAAACQPASTPTPTLPLSPSPTLAPVSSPTTTLLPAPTPTPTPPPPTPTPLPTWPDRWESISPPGGLIQAIAVNPAAPSTLYAAGEGGAVYKSEDGGESWRPGERLVPPTCLFSDLLVDNTNTHIVYVSACNGIYKSSDAGLTWSRADSSIISDTTQLIQSPHAPGLLLAGAANGQVYRSSDGATNWEAISAGLPGEPISGLAISGPDTYWATALGQSDSIPLYRFSAGRWSAVPLDYPSDTIATISVLSDPAAPNVVFVSLMKMSDDQAPVGYLLRSADGGLTWPLLDDENQKYTPARIPAEILGKGPSSGTLYAVTNGKLWASPDEGETWHKVEVGLPNIPSQFNQIAFDPTDDAVLYLALYQGVAKSEDGGLTWRKVNQGLNNANIALIAPHPTDPTTLYAASVSDTGAFKSTDYGESWTRLDVGDDHRPAAELVVNPNHPDTVYQVSDTAHTSRSDDGGAIWSPAWPDLRFSSIPALVSAPSEPNVLYASQDGLGLLRNDNGGSHWDFLRSAGVHNAPALAVHPADANFVLSGDVRPSLETTATLRRSKDGGYTWDAVLELPNASAITSVAFDPRVEPYFASGQRPDDPTRLYAASAGPRGELWRSNDGGDSYKPLNEDFSFTSVRALALSPRRPGVVYAGVWGGGAWRSDDSGASWRRVPGDPATSPVAIVVDHGNYNTVYVADDATPRLYRSEDDGNTWQALFDAGPDYERLVALAQAPSDPSVLYVSALRADGGGTLFLVDANAPLGENASDATGDLPGVATSLAVQRYDSWRVFATTSSGGLYKTMDGGATWRRLQGGLPPDTVFYQVVMDPFWPDSLFLAGGRNVDPQALPRPDEVNGVWRSSDDGNTWRKVGGAVFGQDSGPIRAIVPLQDKDQVVYAAGEGGVYLSADRGELWGNITGRIPFAPMNVIASDGQTLYAGSAGGGVFAGAIHFLIYTADWMDASPLAVPVAQAQIALHPTDPQSLYASAFPGGVYVTHDEGMNWNERNNGLPSYAVLDPARQGRYALAVAPGDAQTLYVGLHGHGVYRSDDGGLNWRAANGDAGELREANVEALLVHPDNAYTVYAATDKGVWRTVNGGRSWAEFGATPARSLALGADGQLYVGTSGYGVLARDAYHQAEDEEWRVLGIGELGIRDWGIGGRRMSLLAPSGDAETIYAAAFPGGLYKTGDGGQSWRQLDVGLGSAGVLSLFAHPDDAGTLYAGTTGGLMRSVNGGESWHLWNAGWPGGQWVTGVAFDPADADVMYACSVVDWILGIGDWGSGAVMKSLDGGETWVEIMSGLNGEQGFYEVLVDRFDESVVYLVTEREGVYLSRDGGATWGEWNEGGEGRVATTVPGAEWKGSGALGLWASADGRLLYFGTTGDGVWRRPAVGGE